MRQRKLKWADEFVEKSEFVLKEFPFSFNYDLLELEIGCGKGNFLTKKALNNPKIIYLGIDIQKSCLAIAAKKASDLDIKNIKFAYMNADKLLDSFTDKFNKIYLNFSDPWPKARHEKRRLTSLRFQKIYHQILNENGLIIFKTDNVSLYEYSKEVLNNEFFTIIYENSDYKLEENEIISEYEEKFRNQGNAIGKIIAKRR